MNPRSYDQLSLLERVLYSECFGGQDQDAYPQPVPYSLIADIRHSGWICTIDDRMLNPDYYYPAPLAHHLDSIEETKPHQPGLPTKNSDSDPQSGLPTKNSDSDPQSGLPTKKTRCDRNPLRQQNQPSDENPTESKWGEYWIEYAYKTVKGVSYGPYRVQRWRDETGRKRSKYLGKPPTETVAPDLPA
jgi:Protein of unknown function (DUF1678)